MGVMENGSKILSAFSVLARFPFERTIIFAFYEIAISINHFGGVGRGACAAGHLSGVTLQR